MKDENNFNEKLLKRRYSIKIQTIVFPLLFHKFESDRLGKHKNWSKRQDFILTNLAILTDVGINVCVLILIFGNYKAAILLKLAHIAGSEIFPPIIAGLIRKFSK